MSTVIFKVVLKGNKQDESEIDGSMTLSFKSTLSKEIIKIPSHFISSLKSMSEHYTNVISFQNLEEVITVGDLSMDYSINYYLVILFLMKSEEKRNGFLIANIKKIGDALIGIWPFTKETTILTEDYIKQKFNDFINNHDNYKNLVIINST
ncbi:MAG: hypothetical protein P8Y23_08455 [Candidatus Lokiarchaeota archaeon]|jgi:hypothetical protein